VRALDLAVQVRAPQADVDVTRAEVLDVPVELRLELMALVGADRVDAEGNRRATESTTLCRLWRSQMRSARMRVASSIAVNW
jgi:hypothetical protein